MAFSFGLFRVKPKCARWKTFWAPAAPVPTADAELQDDGNGPTEAADAAPAPPTREQLLEKAAEEELKTFVGAIIYDGDDAAALLNMLQSQVGLKAPLPQDGRMVLHWDAAKELEASEAYTKSHNVFSRRPGIRKQRASFIRKIADGIFTDVPLHVLLCFDGGSHACANEITRHKGFEWSKLEMMPIAESLTQRETYCWAAGGMKRRKTSVAGVSALSRLAGRETALMGVKKDTPAPKAMPFKWIDAPGSFGHFGTPFAFQKLDHSLTIAFFCARLAHSFLLCRGFGAAQLGGCQFHYQIHGGFSQ